jgi:hypothetical protein
MSRYVSTTLGEYIADKIATQSIIDLAEERETGHVRSKQGYSPGSLGCFPWYVSFPSKNEHMLSRSW